jgi:hypothetical protein
MFPFSCVTGAPLEVNISGVIKAKLISDINNNFATSGCFARIKTEVLKVMQRDNFMRFKAQKEFKVHNDVH